MIGTHRHRDTDEEVEVTEIVQDSADGPGYLVVIAASDGARSEWFPIPFRRTYYGPLEDMPAMEAARRRKVS